MRTLEQVLEQGRKHCAFAVPDLGTDTIDTTLRMWHAMAPPTFTVDDVLGEVEWDLAHQLDAVLEADWTDRAARLAL
jgi:hypothetical protein